MKKKFYKRVLKRFYKQRPPKGQSFKKRFSNAGKELLVRGGIGTAGAGLFGASQLAINSSTKDKLLPNRVL